MARDAARDAGLPAARLAEADAVAIVAPLGWRAANAPRLLADRLGARPADEIQGVVGGEGPIVLLNHLAERIASGRTRLALVASTHHVRTQGRAYRRGLKLAWESGGEGRPRFLGQERDGSSPLERRYGLALPADIYPVFEHSLRGRRGLDLETHRQRMGELMSRFTRVAAANPHAWFPVERSARELVEPGPANRMVSFPYTKYLNSVMETDQAAAVWMTSAATARELGIPEDRLVHWWGGAVAVEEPWHWSERADLSRSAAMRAAARDALASAGSELDEIDAFDLYSCFPSAVEMACDMLGLAEDDPRGLTVTGGLPYAGGPGNAYTLHALAAMAERVRERPGTRGLVTGNGWYVTKHAAVVVASAPRPESAPGRTGVPADEPVAIEGESVLLREEAEGPAAVETYTVGYDRDGAPARGIVVGRLDDGSRFLANTPGDRALLEDFVKHEALGRPGRVEQRDGRNCFLPD